MLEGFDQQAERYQQQFMGLKLYDRSYLAFCDQLPTGAQVLDAACGPGNVSHFLIQQRPDLTILGIDLAPQMLKLAARAVSQAEFKVHDCRQLSTLQQKFDGIICAFGLPYLTEREVRHWILEAKQCLNSSGVLYISTLQKYQSQQHHPKYLYFHSKNSLLKRLEPLSFEVFFQQEIESPSQAQSKTQDFVVIAKKA